MSYFQHVENGVGGEFGFAPVLNFNDDDDAENEDSGNDKSL